MIEATTSQDSKPKSGVASNLLHNLNEESEQLNLSEHNNQEEIRTPYETQQDDSKS